MRTIFQIYQDFYLHYKVIILINNEPIGKAKGSQKVNRRTKLAMDLTEVNDQIGALSNIVSFQDIAISELSNLVVDKISEIASLSNEFYIFKTSTNAKITSLQEFDLIFYNDLRNIDNNIDVVASNISQNASNITSLSNTLVNDYITTSYLNDQLTDTYIPKS